MREIYISMLSFPNEEMSLFGQSSYVDQVIGMGASGVGIHRELLLNDKEITILGEKLAAHNLKVGYCVNDVLFNEEGEVNEQLHAYLEEAAILKASFLKMSLGKYNFASVKWEELKELFHSQEGVQLIIQNDCSEYGGSLSVLKSFITQCYTMNLNVQVAFDCGNWSYVNEDVEFALEELNGYVGLAHLKRIVRDGEVVITVPINNAKEAKWKKVLDSLPECPVCIDFSLHSSEEGKYYVDLIQTYLKTVALV